MQHPLVFSMFTKVKNLSQGKRFCDEETIQQDATKHWLRCASGMTGAVKQLFMC
jgi:hypothetical protein